MKRNRDNILAYRIPRFVTVTTLVTFFALVFVGIFDCANGIMRGYMNTDVSSHAMADCAPGEQCGMDINTHIQVWQGMIAANMPVSFVNLFSALLFAAFVLGICRISVTPHTASSISRYLYYDRDHRESKLYNHFIDIFSSGILQPKLFAQ